MAPRRSLLALAQDVHGIFTGKLERTKAATAELKARFEALSG
jgi:hypothetical protein